MALILIPFCIFNVYVGVCTVQYMNKTIEQRDEKMKLLRLMAEHQKEQK